MPQISVIVPVYKVEPFLRRCVDSILEQTLDDFELILVDDGSPDGCPAICDEYARKDSRVVVIHQKNGGLSVARNAGIDWVFANSDSQWLSFVDSDDWVHPEYLSRLHGEAIAQNADLVFCTLTAFIDDNAGYREIPFWGKPSCDVRSGHEILAEATANRKGLLSGHQVIACNKIYRKHVFSDLRFPVGQVHEDEAIAHRVIGRCDRVAGICDSLYYYRQHAESIMSAQNGIYRNLCISLAYGDRIQYYQEKQIAVSDELFYRYWSTLMWNYYQFSKERRCADLLKKTRRQMRGLECYYRKTGASPFRKIAVRVFCCMPQLISRVFYASVKLRGG